MSLLINIDVPDAEAGHALLHRGVRPYGRPPLRQGFRRAAGLGGAGLPAGQGRRHGRGGRRSAALRAALDAVPSRRRRRLTWMRPSSARWRAGATLEAPARDAPYGRIAMLADPFGHGFCLLQFSARATTRCSPDDGRAAAFSFLPGRKSIAAQGHDSGFLHLIGRNAAQELPFSRPRWAMAPVLSTINRGFSQEPMPIIGSRAASRLSCVR